MSTILDLASLETEEEGKVEPSPSCSLEDQPRNLTSEAPSSNRASTSDSESHPDLQGNNQWHGFIRLLKKGSNMRIQSFGPLKGVPKLTRRKSKRVREELIPPLNTPTSKSSLDGEFCFKSSWINFTLSELQAATNDFSRGTSSIFFFGRIHISFRQKSFFSSQ